MKEIGKEIVLVVSFKEREITPMGLRKKSLVWSRMTSRPL
jgi:hypothetical protein